MVVLPDANILIYAYDERSDVHLLAKNWLEESMTSHQIVLTWQTIMAFVRILTSSRGTSPMRLDDAVSIVTEWLERENVEILSFDKNTWALVADTLIDSQANGDLAMDAHLAALAISRGATLVTRDRDFSRFEGLRSLTPFSK